MIIEYHVHLEEGPYSAYWISQTVNALEFFMKEKTYSYKWMRSLLAKYQIPMTLSSDAHYPDDLGTNLDLAKEHLVEYGYKTLAAFSKRRRFDVPI
ncbi:MAG: hypothetical protein QM315_07355 [Bacillota bacterium]|nr:hypothetical protein [Bacillota bacterium]NLV63301.1 hypothetical protein [Clostridiaceae bacterium]